MKGISLVSLRAVILNWGQSASWDIWQCLELFLNVKAWGQWVLLVCSTNFGTRIPGSESQPLCILQQSPYASVPHFVAKVVRSVYRAMVRIK